MFRAKSLAMTIAALASVVLAAGGVLAEASGAPNAAQQTQAPAQARRTPTPHVVAISVDGLNPKALQILGSQLPSINGLIRSGRSTMNARTMVERTITLPNHTSMVTGKRILGPSGHGVSANRTQPDGTTLLSLTGRMSNSIFTQVKAGGGESALFAAKKKFNLWTSSWSSAFAKTCTTDSLNQCPAEAANYLRSNDPDFTFVHIADADRAGHASGFLSSTYLQAVKNADTRVGQVLDAIKANPSLTDSTYVILTSDHGGNGRRGHSKVKDRANYTVPFVVDGPGVTAGSELYSINPWAKNPGRSRPGYIGRQPIRNGYLANLAAKLLNLAPIPGSNQNFAQLLAVK